MVCVKHWLCEYVNQPCVFVVPVREAGGIPGAFIPPPSVDAGVLSGMRDMWRQLDPGKSQAFDRKPAEALATAIRDEIQRSRYLDNEKGEARARPLIEEFSRPHPGRQLKVTKDSVEDVGMISGGQLRAKWSGDGNSFTVELHATESQFDMDGPCAIKIVGEWEWADFVAFVNLVNRQIDGEADEPGAVK